MGRAAMREVLAGFIQTEGSVDGEADFGCVVVLLAIVLPPADGAQGQRTGGFQGLIAAAWTSIANLQKFPRMCGRERGVRVYMKDDDSQLWRSEGAA
jgi:hypothetical protein